MFNIKTIRTILKRIKATCFKIFQLCRRVTLGFIIKTAPGLIGIVCKVEQWLQSTIVKEDFSKVLPT